MSKRTMGFMPVPDVYPLRILLAWLLVTSGICLAQDNVIRVGGSPRELTIDSMGERTLRITFFPLDGDGRPVPSPPTAVFVPYEAVERLRVRELSAVRTIDAGTLRVEI